MESRPDSFELTADDFRACSGTKAGAQYLHERFNQLRETIKSEHPRYDEPEFVSYTAHPFKRQGRGHPGEWRNHSWVSFTDAASLPGKKQQWVQLQVSINSSTLDTIVWIDWRAPKSTWRLVERNVARNGSTLKEALGTLAEDYEAIVYDEDEKVILRFGCADATDDDIKELRESFQTARALWIGKEQKKHDAIALGTGLVDFVDKSFEEMMPAYLSIVGRGSDARRILGAGGPGTEGRRKRVLFANISWNPYGWTKAYKNRKAPHRYVQRFPGHESLNFDFEKGGIDTPINIFGYCEFSNNPIYLAGDATVFFYSRDYLSTGRGYIVGVYGGARLIKLRSEPYLGFENDTISLNLRADPKLSFRFPVRLDSRLYIKTRVGQAGFSYGNVETAEKILLDEYEACVKAGDASCLPKLVDLYSNITGRAFPTDTYPPVTIQETEDGTKVDVENDVSLEDAQKEIERAKQFLEKESGGAVTTSMPPVDTSGLFKPTSSFAGPLSGRPHVKAYTETKIGRGMNLNPRAVEGCPGGVVLEERGYEGKCTDEELRNFAARIRKLMDAIKGDGDGPNPDNVRIMITNASTDAKLLPKDGLIGFNAIDRLEGDPFWVMAAAREVAYLKYRNWYQHLRLMTALVLRAFSNLGWATSPGFRAYTRTISHQQSTHFPSMNRERVSNLEFGNPCDPFFGPNSVSNCEDSSG